MNDYLVTLERYSSGWYWIISKDGMELTGWTFTKSGAKRQVLRAIHKWEKQPIIETYTVKGKNK